MWPCGCSLRGFYRVLSHSLSDRRVKWILPSIVITLGKRGLVTLPFLVCDLCTVCLGLCALPLGVTGRLCSVFVALPGHLLNYF